MIAPTTNISSKGNVIYINGNLSFATVPNINKQVRVFIKQNSHIVFDLSGVKFSDNAGVALLISSMRYGKNGAKDISFINLSQQFLDLISASGLEEILPLK
jgi:anti-anti-sigma factor